MTWSNVVRGVAIGDAWGDPNEFQRISTLTSNNPQGPALPGKLRVTDDTQMTLFLASALDDSWGGTADEVKAAIQEAFLAYRSDPDTGSRAPGVTVMGSLARLAQGKVWQDATSTSSDGSGTVMRTSSTAFLPEDRWVGVSAFAAAVTHGTANGIAAAILDAAILREIERGDIKAGELVARALELASDPGAYGLLDTGEWLTGYEVDLSPGFAELARLLGHAVTELPDLQADPWALGADPSSAATMRGGGWRAHETLVIALLAVDMFPADPWAALRRSVTTDGDSDTIGAVTGALLGALGTDWGTTMERMEPRYRRWIENEADDFPFEVFATSKVKRLAGLRSLIDGLLARV